MDVEYRPSVCHQTDDEHSHHSIVLVVSPNISLTNLDLLRKLAAKVGGRTAGQVISMILEKRSIGVDLAIYGIDYLKTETIPSYQICHKGEVDSPTLDWDFNIFTPLVEVAIVPPANTKVAKIRH